MIEIQMEIETEMFRGLRTEIENEIENEIEIELGIGIEIEIESATEKVHLDREWTFWGVQNGRLSDDFRSEIDPRRSISGRFWALVEVEIEIEIETEAETEIETELVCFGDTLGSKMDDFRSILGPKSIRDGRFPDDFGLS